MDLSTGPIVLSCKSVHKSVMARVPCCPTRMSRSLPVIHGHTLPLIYGQNLPLIYGHNLPPIYGHNLPLLFGHKADPGWISQLEPQCLARVSTRVPWQECLPACQVCSISRSSPVVASCKSVPKLCHSIIAEVLLFNGHNLP